MIKISTTDDVIRHLESNGFKLVKTRGSHKMYKNDVSGALITIPVTRKTLPNGTIHAILKQVEISAMKQ
ncbi:type II toxin-antitoxin system HicA family toxin [Photobacterium leiognathi]|uniref:type II toxin-antitoxin system HicA family toxin n=1 Tax=Photobacterium leiognathi TaxID=553611 RepID=UPI0015E793E2